MAWKRVNNEDEAHPNFIKWTTVGQELEGEWEGTSEGKFGELGQINGTKFPLHTVLARAFTEISEGTKVKVVYLGMMTSKRGSRYKGFDVFIEE